MFQQRCGFYDRAWYIKACIRYHDLEGKVPRFKHETFSSLPYATDLYSKSLALYKESLNRTTKLAANSTDGNVISSGMFNL